MLSSIIALYLGTWNCDRPSVDSGYHTRLTVTQSSDGWLDFIDDGIGANRNHGMLFSIAPSGGSWTLESVDYGYPLTGAWDNGTIVFAPAAPNPQRFQLMLSNDNRTMSFVEYTKYGFDISRQYRTTTCTRGST
jgi:hypothetical protein